MLIDAYLYLKKDGAQIEGEATDKVFAGFIEVHKFDINALKDPSDEKEKFEVNRDLYHERQQYDWALSDMGGLFGGESEASTAVDDQGEDILGDTDDAFSFKISKDMDSSSPALFLNYCESYFSHGDKPFDRAVVYLRKAGPWVTQKGLTPQQSSFLIITFDKPYVVSYSVSAQGDSSIPEESVKFYFSKYAVQYKTQDADGTLQAASQSPIGWSIGEGDDGGKPWDGAE